MPRCSQRVVPLTGDPQGIPTNTPDQFPAQAEGLGGPCGTRGTPTPYGAIRASKNAQDHLKVRRAHKVNVSVPTALYDHATTNYTQ